MIQGCRERGWREKEEMKEGCRDGQSERQRGWTSAAGIWLFIVQMSSLLLPELIVCSPSLSPPLPPNLRLPLSFLTPSSSSLQSDFMSALLSISTVLHLSFPVFLFHLILGQRSPLCLPPSPLSHPRASLPWRFFSNVMQRPSQTHCGAWGGGGSRG